MQFGTHNATDFRCADWLLLRISRFHSRCLALPHAADVPRTWPALLGSSANPLTNCLRRGARIIKLAARDPEWTAVLIQACRNPVCIERRRVCSTRVRQNRSMILHGKEKQGHQSESATGIRLRLLSRFFLDVLLQIVHALTYACRSLKRG